MQKKKRIVYVIFLAPVLAILFFLGWFFANIFEGEKPSIAISPRPEYLSQRTLFTLKAGDAKRGLKKVKVSVKQEGREITILEETYPFKGLFNREGVKRYEKEIFMDPQLLNLAQGRVDLNATAWDYSRRGGGDGNMTIAHHKMIIDTLPPAVRTISRMHNINSGGAGLVVYQASSDTSRSGLYVDKHFYQGFRKDDDTQEGVYLSYFAMPHDLDQNPSVFLWAEDRAGNQSKASFYLHIRKKRFRSDKIVITDRFLDRILPYFTFYLKDSSGNPVDQYLRINNDLRSKNHETLLELSRNTSPRRLWEGSWLGLKNAAAMAAFGDRRVYYYQNQKIDEKIHLGVDLASLANSPVPAGNHGRVVLADRLGIYGQTVVLDHGQGIASLYGHLSQIHVSLGQEVKKGDIIGLTGQTGLAGGDHLHFSMMVNGVFVNPIEWWDDHWIQDNITKKLSLVD